MFVLTRGIERCSSHAPTVFDHEFVPLLLSPGATRRFNLHSPTPRFRPTHFFLKCSPRARLAGINLPESRLILRRDFRKNPISYRTPTILVFSWRVATNVRDTRGCVIEREDRCGGPIVSQQSASHADGSVR